MIKVKKLFNPVYFMKNKYWWLMGLIFGLIFCSRLVFLAADLPSTHVEIEEKPGGYNARNMIFFQQWPLYHNWFQPMVYVPVQNFLTYWTFRCLGVGLYQFRLPTALAACLGLIFFFLVLLKQTNRTLALLGLLVYAFNFEMTVWNRSALSENLYLFLMPLAVYWLSRENVKNRDIFILVFLAALNIVVKLDGYSFYLAMVLFLGFWSLKTKAGVKNIQAIVLGSLAGLLVLLALFAFSGSFKYFSPMYRFYFDLFAKQASLFQGWASTGQELVTLLLKIDPYLLLAFSAALPALIINQRRFNKTDWLLVGFLFLAVITRLQIPAYLIYWKRTIFLFFPLIYLVFRVLFFLETDADPARKTSKPISILAVASLLANLFLYLGYFDKPIPSLYAFNGLSESFHYSRGVFSYLFFITLGIFCLNFLLIFAERRCLKNILMSLILFFIFTSFLTNGLKVARIYLPENVRYSYQDNQKFSALIPENTMIVGHEQALRAFAYLSRHQFYYNHDGGPNPIAYREVLEREDLRYFILNIEEFWREHWGIPNQIRLELIRQAYPDLKLLGVMFASKVPLAIYDKYGQP